MIEQSTVVGISGIILALSFSAYMLTKVISAMKRDELDHREMMLQRKEVELRESELKQKSKWNEYQDIRQELRAANETCIYQSKQIETLRGKILELEHELKAFNIISSEDKLLRKIL